MVCVRGVCVAVAPGAIRAASESPQVSPASSPSNVPVVLEPEPAPAATPYAPKEKPKHLQAAPVTPSSPADPAAWVDAKLMWTRQGALRRKRFGVYKPTYVVLSGTCVRAVCCFCVACLFHHRRPWTSSADALLLQLAYYDHQGGDKQGEVTLTESTVVNPVDPREFAVLYSDGQKLQCEAPDAAARDGWVKAITHNINALRAGDAGAVSPAAPSPPPEHEDAAAVASTSSVRSTGALCCLSVEVCASLPLALCAAVQPSVDTRTRSPLVDESTGTTVGAPSATSSGSAEEATKISPTIASTIEAARSGTPEPARPAGSRFSAFASSNGRATLRSAVAKKGPIRKKGLGGFKAAFLVLSSDCKVRHCCCHAMWSVLNTCWGVW